MSLNYKVADLSLGVKQIISRVVAGSEVSVVETSRIKAAAALCFKSKTIYLDPSLCFLYDLCFCSQLLKKDSQARILSQDLGINMTTGLTSEWSSEAKELIAKRFPALGDAYGYFVSKDDVPQLSWSDPDFESLNEEDVKNQPMGFADIQCLPGGEHSGIDFESELIWKLKHRKLIYENFDEFPSYPLVNAPMDYSLVVDSVQLRKECEKRLKGVEYIVDNYSECMRKSMETILEQPFLRERRTTGALLDPTKIYEAEIARYTGQPAQVFMKKSSRIQPSFRPEEHTAVVMIDLNSLHKEELHMPLGGAYSRSFPFVMLKSLERLEIETIVLVYSDCWIHEPEPAYLHMRACIKTVEQEFDARFWARLTVALGQPPLSLGSPASCTLKYYKELKQIAETEAAKSKKTHLHFYSFFAESADMRRFAGTATYEEHAKQINRIYSELADSFKIRGFAKVPQRIACALPKGSPLQKEQED